MKNCKKYLYLSLSLLFFVIVCGALTACGGGGDKKISVTFDDMYGSKTVQKVKKGSLATDFVPEVPVEDVYDQYGNVVSTQELDVTFYKWYIDQQFITEYDFETPVTAPITLYARWITDRVVSFDTGGGSSLNNINVGVIRSQAEIEELTGVVMEKEGYAFKGWYTDSDLNNPVVYPYILTGNKTLYAKWDVEGFLVTFYCINGLQCKEPYNVLTPNQKLGVYISNDGTLGIEAVSDYIDANDNEHGDKYYGYTFEGWYTEPTFEPSSKIKEEDYLNITIDSSMNIYGNFIINEYSVKVYYNIADKTDLNGTIFKKKYNSVLLANELMTIKAPDGSSTSVTNEGKKIKGWYTDENCTIPYDFSKPIIGEVILFAEWENISGYINVDYNNGLVGGDEFTELERLPGDKIEDIYTTLNLEEPVRKGYEFKGWSYQLENDYVCTWYKASDGTLQEYSCTNGTSKYIYTNSSGIYRWYLNGDPTSDISPTNFTYIVAQLNNPKISAVWEGTEYTVILNYYNGVADIRDTLDGKYAYDSIIYSSDIEMGDKVGYELRGFSWTEGLTTCTTGTCFTFPITLGGVIDAGQDTDEIIELYAVYEPMSLNVIFNSNGGVFGRNGANYILPSTAVHSSHIIRFNTTWDYEFMNSVFGNSVQNPSLYLAKTDYQFIGWSTNRNASTEEECEYVHKAGNSITFTNTTQITYYAIWKNEAKTFTFKGYEYDEGSSKYISSVSEFSANIGLSINVYSYYKTQTSNELINATSNVVDNEQFVGWYYCLTTVQDCSPTTSNRINVDTYITVQANLTFYAEYAPTKLSYRLVDTGVSKYYAVSGLFAGSSASEYKVVEIPSYYMGFVVRAIDAGVFDNCNDIHKLTLPTTLGNSTVKGKFANSLKIVDLTITKDILSYLGSTGDSIFGANSTYMISKICSLNIIDLGDESIENLISSNRVDLDVYTSLTMINNTYVESNKMANAITLHLLIDKEATFVEVGRDGYPVAYMAGYTFMGWKLAKAETNATSYKKYTYSLDDLVVAGNVNNYVPTGEILTFDGNLGDLNNKTMIAIFEKWSNVLTIYDSSDTSTVLFSSNKNSGDLLYSDDYVDSLKASNKLFAGFYYDPACITPVLSEDRMPYTKPLTMYAKFIASNINVTYDEDNINLTLSLKEATSGEVYIPKYYKGKLVNNVTLTVNSGVTQPKISKLYIPARFMVKLNAKFSATASNTLFISINDCTIDDVVLYGSNDETVKTTNIAVFSDLLTTITLYDNLSVEVDAFDTFELLEKFDVVCTGGTSSKVVGGVDKVICNTENKNLLVSNNILYREVGNSYYLVRVPINHATTDFSSSQTGSSIVGGDIPSTVIGINPHAFYNCANIVKLTIPTNIKYIGEYALANMTSLTTLDGLADVESIADINVFDNDINLSSVSISTGNGNYTSVEGVILNTEKTVLIFFPKAYVFAGTRLYSLPTTVQTIGSKAFDLRDSKPITLSIGPGVSVIADDAFFNISEFRLSSTSNSLAVENGNLYKYRNNNDVVELYELIRFADASGETMYVLPNTIETVNPYAFANATSLRRIIYDNKTIQNSTNIGVEKNILIGSFNGDETTSVYENFDKMELYGYNANVYISKKSTFTIYDVYNVALPEFESSFRSWLRTQGYVIGEIEEEEDEISNLLVSISSTDTFTVNGVNTNVPVFTTTYTDLIDNFKFSRWVQSLGVGKGESTVVGVHEEVVYVGDKTTGISVDLVDKGEVYMHFVGSKELVLDNGMVNSIVVSQDKDFDINYSILVTKDIYLMSIANVYYNGELVPEVEDGNFGSYKVSDNGILSKEPVTTYENLDFRGWYVQNGDVVGIYGERVKFPLMINDLTASENESPQLNAAFTVHGFKSNISLKVDFNVHGFVWNNVEYAAPGYEWVICSTSGTACNNTVDGSSGQIKDEEGNLVKGLILKDSSKVLTKGYWTASVISDGNHKVDHLTSIDDEVRLYYRSSKKSNNSYVETYSLINFSFFTTIESVELYILPNSYVAKSSVVILNFNDSTEDINVTTPYFDPSIWIPKDYHALAQGTTLGVDSDLINYGHNIDEGANRTYIVINQKTTRTNVIIKVYVGENASYEDQLRIVIGQYTYSHTELVLDEDTDEYYYLFNCVDDSSSSAFYAVEGAILDFNTVTVQEGTKPYSFADKYTKTSSGSKTSDVYYLTGNDITFVTSLK